MAKYYFWRIVKSIISIFIVVAIVIAMVFTMIPKDRIFKEDTTYNKLLGNEKLNYKYNMLMDLGYLDYKSIGQMCAAEEAGSDCVVNDSETQKEILAKFESKGYEIMTFQSAGARQGEHFGIKEYNVIELVSKYFSNMFVIDRPGKVQDPNNKALDENRGYYIGKDHNGVPALMCTGCEYKYQIYFDGKFPFIHNNIFGLNFGTSFPARKGTPVLEVISSGQGNTVERDIVYPTGYEGRGAENLHSLKYKEKLTRIEERKYPDNYADARLNYDAPSMIGISYIFGILSVIFAYMIGIPAGVIMARNKGKFADKAGIVYINLLVALPSLAFIYIMKYIGNYFSLPDKFPHLGPGNIKSYILPLLILTIMSTPGLMTWVRRYMIDQQSADYVKFARAKGLSRSEISRNHILKNAIIPIVNGIPGSIILAISGAVITEAVFAIPGMGKMLPDAINGLNNNMVIALTFIFTTLSILSVLLGDILMTIVDPRISLNAKKGDL
ncbi:ABC transporter permease [uncultured Ezakiella sp.]|uniref:ABC transporter permease n=1 Tax=uncultured Ezakiella sp. TaxID=1637529 RepID=UPI0025FFD935|nr:ABC transporter permease [uncultured Ezakiella sp.]